MGERLRVVLATPLEEELCVLIEDAEPRIELVRDHSLLPSQRHPGDHSGDPDWTRTPEQQARFDELLATADVLYGIPDVDVRALRRVVEANPGLRWVQTMAAGGGASVRAAGLSEEQLARITFTTSAGVHGGPLAEFALFGLLAGAKSLPRLRRHQAAHDWADRWFMGQLEHQTVLVVGLGGIGIEVARRLQVFGTTVIGTSRHGGAPPEFVDEVVHPDELEAAVGRVDGIVVTLPGTAATEKLISAAVLDAVRPGATLVSVGRGTVIDEDALVGALRDGRIGFAALDVVAVEPLPADSPLWDLPNVILSPHTAALDEAEDRRIAELFADNARRLLDGEPLRNVVDTVEFY
ncbi:MAG: D-2-hydroxyacid dehydrogenase [Pseudonocardia sp.]|nr:D-2-hydroxyacid dehydrogenase [Pseudonocardia sp.]